jgi:PAS domain S-box-containing protein
MLVEMAPDVIYSLAADNGSITELSPSFEAVTGWSRSVWLGKSFTGLIHPEDLPAAIQLYTQVLQGLTPPPFELRIRAANGTYLTGEFRSRPQFDGGRVIGEVGIVRDITERTRAHEALRASELQLAGILGSAMDAILTIDADGRIVFFNRAAERMFGCSAEESIGKPAGSFLPTRFGLLDDAFGGLSRREMLMPAVPRVSTAVGADGTEFPIEATISALEVNGRWLCTVIARDITERHRAEMELQQAKSDAEAANSAKDHFLAVLSHELRTPLTPVLAAVQALEVEPHLSDFVQTFLQIIRRNVELEARLIDDLLDLTRIARGKIQLESEVVDLHSLIASVIEICEEDLSKKNFSVPLDLEATIHHVLGDPARLQQVLWNLIKNAVKFTPEGGWIAVRTRNVQNGMIEVEVDDSGIGIEGENLDRIFDAFDQGGLPAGRRSGGLGLGLAISKALVDMHHGTLVAHSRGAGSGSSFFVTLPTVEAKADGKAGESAASRGAGGEGRILLVDDHADTAQSLALLLRRFGYEVTVAESVASAIAEAQHASFDLLVSDIGLPDGTGHDVIQEVKKIAPVLGIALSGFGMEDDVRRSLEAGFSEHLIKPVNVGRLHETIQRLLNNKSSGTHG